MSEETVVRKGEFKEPPLPKSFDEAVEMFLVQLKDAVDHKILLPEDLVDSEKLVSQLHFGTGMAMRNAWGLWKENELTKEFNSRGIFHADDMSSLIMLAAIQKYKEEPFDFDEEAKKLWKYWIETDPTDCGKKTKEYLEATGKKL